MTREQIKRLLIEHYELTTRLRELRVYTIIDNVSDDERRDIEMQRDCMCTYLTILDRRLARIGL